METVCIPVPVNKRCFSKRMPQLQDLETLVRPLEQRQERIFTRFPINKRCPFLEEENECVRRNPQFEGLENFVTPLERRERIFTRFPINKKNLKSRQFFDLERRQVDPMLECDEEENMEFPIRRLYKQQCQKLTNTHMWYTVVPLEVPVRPEEVKVQLNPVCHMLVIKATPRMALKQLTRKTQFRGIDTTQLQQIHRLVTLPKTIRMEKIQVKLNPRGELIILAPYKTEQGRHMKNMLPPFSQEEERDIQQWITIPITKLQDNKKRFTSRRFPVGQQEWSETSSSSSSSSSESETETESEEERETFPIRRRRNVFQQSESDTETETESETDSETETETESESEYENEMEMFQGRHQIIMEQLERINIRTSVKLQVKKFVQLLEKIFYPNIVLVKLVRGEKKQLQVVVTIKFVDFQREEIKVRLHQTQSVLVVEGKKLRKMRQFGAALKYVRREIQLPQVFNVKKVVYRVLENGNVCVKLPFLTSIISGKQQFQQHEQQLCQRKEFTPRATCPHMMNFISEPAQLTKRQTRRNWKVLTQRCRPTTRRC